MYITKKLIINEELSELDLDLGEKFKFDYENDDDFITLEKNTSKNDWYINTTPIDIDVLDDLIKKFKKKGVTHIQMEHHGDHYGYIFSGVKIGLSSKQEIDDFNDVSKAKCVNDKKITELLIEVDRLRNEDYDSKRIY